MPPHLSEAALFVLLLLPAPSYALSFASFPSGRFTRFNAKSKTTIVDRSRGPDDRKQLEDVVFGVAKSEIVPRPLSKKRKKVFRQAKRRAFAKCKPSQEQSAFSFASLGEELGIYGRYEKLTAIPYPVLFLDVKSLNVSLTSQTESDSADSKSGYYPHSRLSIRRLAAFS